MAPAAGERLQVFGTEHLLVLIVFAVGCVAVVLLGRRLEDPVKRRFERITGAAILAACMPFEVADWIDAIRAWPTDLPVQICDFAWAIAGIALITRGRPWCALLYYWGLTLGLQGVITPDLDHVFPDLQFLGFWIRHLAPVWASLYLVGAGVGPSWREYRFVLALTAVWAATLMALNQIFGSNYGYLRAKPSSHSLLDLLGPWPWYVGIEVVLVISVWALMTLPWVRSRDFGFRNRL